jgi:hypothetical protein
MKETSGVGVIVLLGVYLWWSNYQGEEIKKEVAKAQKGAANVAMPSPPPGYPFPPGTGWKGDAARAQQENARYMQERFQVIGQQIANEQARNFKPPQVPQQPGIRRW